MARQATRGGGIGDVGSVGGVGGVSGLFGSVRHLKQPAHLRE